MSDCIFKALDSTCSRLHQRLQNSCKGPAISSRQDVKSIGKGKLYLGPLHIIDQILESVMIFKSNSKPTYTIKATANKNPAMDSSRGHQGGLNSLQAKIKDSYFVITTFLNIFDCYELIFFFLLQKSWRLLMMAKISIYTNMIGARLFFLCRL